jgi:hypothetical protein
MDNLHAHGQFTRVDIHYENLIVPARDVHINLKSPVKSHSWISPIISTVQLISLLISGTITCLAWRDELSDRRSRPS